MGVSADNPESRAWISTSGPAAYSQLTGFKGQSVSGRPGLSPMNPYSGRQAFADGNTEEGRWRESKASADLQRGHEGPRTPCCASRPNMLPTNISCNSLGLGLCSLRFDIEET